MAPLKRFFIKLSNWELWPFTIIYAPLGFVWLYFAFRARAFWFFSNVNPTLEFAGFEGETKKEMYEQLPSDLYPATLHIPAKTDFAVVLAALLNSAISYPMAAKPEVGMQGILFRKIDTKEQLAEYHQHIPVDYIIQEFVDLPLELSVFYIRYPRQAKGKVTGLILKEYMFVTGDGLSTLQHLIRQHPKALNRQKEMEHKHADNLDTVLKKGEKYTLSIAGNHNRGARFVNLHKEIDEQLCEVFDGISKKAQHFHYGRYDLKCTALEDLKAGRNFCILEFNGAGAEPNHIYDCGMSYFEALREVARHWNDLYEIGKINYAKGIPYWGFVRGYRYLTNASRFFENLRKFDDLY